MMLSLEQEKEIISGVINKGSFKYIVSIDNVTPEGVSICCDKALPLSKKYDIEFVIKGGGSRVDLKGVPAKIDDMNIIEASGKTVYQYDMAFMGDELSVYANEFMSALELM